MTPYQAAKGRAPDLSDLCMFGCPCYVYVPKAIRRKGESKAFPGVFVGYDVLRWGYRVLPLGKSQYVVARSVIFDESTLYENIKKVAVMDSGMDNGQHEGVEVVVNVHDNAAEQKEQASREVHESFKQVRRSERLRQQHSSSLVELCGSCYVGELLPNSIPDCAKDVLRSPDKEKWMEAIEQEKKSLELHNVFGPKQLLPQGQIATNVSFIFAKKTGLDGKDERYKARMVYRHNK
jgi:hypothetical protein